MKKITTLSTILIAASLIFLMSACIWVKSVRGNGNVVKETRQVNPFTGVDASAGINVYLFQGNEEKVVVEADENIKDLIVTRVEGDVLKCYVKGSILSSKKMNVYVNFKTLNKINASSGSDVFGETVINAERLDLDVSSGAEMKVEVNATHIKCNASSGSDAIVKGTASSFKAEASSGSDINAENLTVKSCDASASSAGEIKITVTEQITADASSGGDVRYYGNPKNERINESSGGDVSRK